MCCACNAVSKLIVACACARSKDYLHCVLSLEGATTTWTKCGAGPRPSPARVCSCIPANWPSMACRWGRQRAAAIPGSRPLREAAASERRACRTLIARGPHSAKDPGLLPFSFTSGVPLHSDAASRLACAARDVRGSQTDLVQRDAASDGMARAGVQPKWKSFRATPRRAHGPESRVRSRTATQTGRNDWAAPEPVTGTFLDRASIHPDEKSHAQAIRGAGAAGSAVLCGKPPGLRAQAPGDPFADVKNPCLLSARRRVAPPQVTGGQDVPVAADGPGA
jgi:hypothetical protein